MDMPPGTKLVGLHLFYRNDLPEGFGVGLDEEFFADHPEVESSMVICSQLSIEQYQKQRTDKQRRRFVRDIVSQFKQACKLMHQIKAEPQIDEQFMSTFLVLLDDMSFLQSVGLLPNNEYNGPQWIWCKDNTEVK